MKYDQLAWVHYPIIRHRLGSNEMQEMLAVCVDFEIDPASLDAVLAVMEKMCQIY